MVDRDLAAFHDAHMGGLARDAGTAMAGQLLDEGWTSGTVLDLGCRTGHASEALLAAGFDVVAADPSAPMLALAAKRAEGARLVESSVAGIKWPVGLVGLLTCDEALSRDLLIDLDETLEAVHGALRPGGVIMLDVAGPGRHGGAEGSLEVHDVKGAFATVASAEERLRVTRTTTLFTHTGRGSYRRRNATEELRLYPAEDVRAGLARAGFVAIKPIARYVEGGTAFGPARPAFVAARP